MSISVQSIFDLVGTNVVAVEWDDRPVNKAGDSSCAMGVTVATTRRGKITASTAYIQPLPTAQNLRRVSVFEEALTQVLARTRSSLLTLQGMACKNRITGDSHRRW